MRGRISQGMMAPQTKADTSAAKDEALPPATSIYDFLISCLGTAVYVGIFFFGLISAILLGCILGRPVFHFFRVLYRDEPGTAWQAADFECMPFYMITIFMLLGGLFRNQHEFEALTDSTARNRWLAWFFARLFVESLMVLMVLDVLMYTSAALSLVWRASAS